MKRFVFMSLAAVMIVLAAVSLSSCGDDSNDNGYTPAATLKYEVSASGGWGIMKSEGQTAYTQSQIMQYYADAINKVSGCTATLTPSDTFPYISVAVSGTDASKYDTNIKNACSAAESTIKALDLSHNTNTMTVVAKKYTESGSSTIYSGSISGTATKTN